MSNVAVKVADVETGGLLYRDTSDNVSTATNHASHLSNYDPDYDVTLFPNETSQNLTDRTV